MVLSVYLKEHGYTFISYLDAVKSWGILILMKTTNSDIITNMLIQFSNSK